MDTLIKYELSIDIFEPLIIIKLISKSKWNYVKLNYITLGYITLGSPTLKGEFLLNLKQYQNIYITLQAAIFFVIP
jgi:hypothetical protein